MKASFKMIKEFLFFPKLFQHWAAQHFQDSCLKE
jgi:hypothetical protein